MILLQNRYPKFTLVDKIQVFKEKPLIVYAALDWGLGHTTRSIVVIRELLGLGCRVIVACNSIQKRIFEAEFPDLSYCDIFGYEIRYGGSRTMTLSKIFIQSWKLLMKVKAENRWLVGFLSQNQVDGVISDNRYGFYSDTVPSILITHQLKIFSGLGRLTDRFIQKRLYGLINKFSACWVPDYQVNGLAGKLSNPDILPKIPVHYIGLLTRMHSCINPAVQYKYCFILSGPEPQRTILEEKILDNFPGNSLLIRGLPQEKMTIADAYSFDDNRTASNNEAALNNKKLRIALTTKNATIINYADAALLNQLVCSSETIVCRSGYSSMMELIPLNKQLLVIPTPGQGEQEYLAAYLSERGYVKTVSQKNFTSSSLSP